MSKRLLVDISAHGFGHAVQTCVVLNRLARLHPDVELVITSAVPHSFLAARLQHPFDYHPRSSDFGMHMVSALHVDRRSSFQAYRRLHRRWHQKVDEYAEHLGAISPTLILSNIAYLPLAAAQRLNLPAVALSCLNWADIFRHYFHDHPEAQHIFRQIRDAYRSADQFLLATPYMPLSWMMPLTIVGPIAEPGSSRRADIDDLLNLPKNVRLVTVGLGGIDTSPPVRYLATDPGIIWLVPRQWGLRQSNVIDLEALPYSFRDLTASSDLVVTKPGYGSFVELACLGKPVLYLERPDWPESKYLIEWFGRHTRCNAITAPALSRPGIAQQIEHLLALPPAPRPRPWGNDQAAHYLSRRLTLPT